MNDRLNRAQSLANDARKAIGNLLVLYQGIASQTQVYSEETALNTWHDTQTLMDLHGRVLADCDLIMDVANRAESNYVVLTRLRQEYE